jgi:carbohydrate-selective porin OprB
MIQVFQKFGTLWAILLMLPVSLRAQETIPSKPTLSSSTSACSNSCEKESPLLCWWHGGSVSETCQKSKAYLAGLTGEAYEKSKAHFEKLSSSVTTMEEWESDLQNYWSGNGATANWLGLGKTFKDYGLTITGQAKEVFLGQVTPAAQPANARGRISGVPVDNWSTEVKMGFNYDFGKVFGFTGLSVQSDWRYRNVDGNPNCPYTAQAAGTSGVFNPNKDTSGMGVRIMSQYFLYKTDKTSDPQFLLKLGWINPYEDFLTQPESKNFENNAIASAKGIGGAVGGYSQGGKTYSVTSVPWSSSYDSWGGMLRAKPSASTYVQTYLGLAIAGYSGIQASSTKAANYNNHGFNFQGTAAFDPNSTAYGQNGVYNVNEAGWTPKVGADKLEGRYAIGSYIWGQNNNNFGSRSGNGTIWGLYIQGDQRLTAVHNQVSSAPSLDKNPVGGKNPSASTTVADKTRGLYSFTEFTFTPASTCTLPYYYQTGLVYKGLFEARKNDKMGVAVGEGFYSSNFNSTLPKNQGGAANSYATQFFSTTAVFEWFYTVSINKWLDFVPDAQYIVNPSGNGSTGNAAILGFTIAAKF